MSGKRIAQRLVTSPKSVASRIEHSYAKIDASTPATSSLFAVQHARELVLGARAWTRRAAVLPSQR
jgi:hypothetical protein